MECWRLILQIHKLPQSSLAELARNSVRQSGFEMEIKRHWLGNHWYLPGAAGNDINKVHDFSLFPNIQFTNNAYYVQCRQTFLISGWLIGTRRWWTNLIWYAEKLRKELSSQDACCGNDLKIYCTLYFVVRAPVLIPVLPNLVYRADLATSPHLCTHNNNNNNNMVDWACNTFTLAPSSSLSINRGPDARCDCLNIFICGDHHWPSLEPRSQDRPLRGFDLA